MKRILIALSLLGPVLASAPAAAQAYPARPLKLVVPFAAGGPADALARIFAERFATEIGQPVVIENRLGAGGVTGVGAVAKSAPDGYTLGIGSSGTLAISASLQEKMPYDSLRDLTLITQAVSAPELLAINPKVNASTLDEFIALARATPGKYTFASSGAGGMPHLAGELLKLTAKVDIVHVPYTGAAPAVNDLLAGHVDMMFADAPVLLGAVQSGKLKALAVGSKSRIRVLPDVRTTTELNWPDIEADNWYGLIAPVGLPGDILAKIHQRAVAALNHDSVKNKLEEQGFGVVANTTEAFTAYVRYETERWRKVITTGKIKTN